ncbi:MEKHLA domain-containing protein [Methylomagnum sp.]
MTAFPLPSEDNAYLAEHVAILRYSLRHWTGRELVDPRMTDVDAARFLFRARFAVASHDTAPDPLFNYANQTAMSLFAMSWEEITACPSRLSAERVNQESRELLLCKVAEQGYVDDYRGVRVGRHGRRFEIEGAVIWNLLDQRGIACGQAAMFEHWKWA